MTDLNRDDLISAISDTFKDIHGVRPRFFNFNAMSIAELEKEADRLYAQAREHFAEEEVRQAESAKQFEARVAELVTIGAGDRETALRWLMEADDCDSLDEVEYYHDLPWRYLQKAA